MSAEEILRNGETQAVSGAPSLYTGTGKSPKPLKVKKSRSGFATVLILLGLLGGGVAFLGSSESLLIGALPSLLTDQLNPQHVSLSRRTLTKIEEQLAGKTKMSDKLIQKLERQGDFKVEKKGSKHIIKFKDQTITNSNFKEVYTNNTEFRSAYDRATKTRVLGFLDDSAVKSKKYYDITNNKLRDYRETNDMEENRKNYRDTLAPDFENLETETGKAREKEVTDDDGNKSIEYDMDDSAKSSKIDSDSSTVTPEAKTKAKSYIEGVANTTAAATQGVCTVLRTGGMIAAAIAGVESAYAMKYAMTKLESYSKAQDGFSDSSAINIVNNELTSPATVNITDMSKINQNNSKDEDAGQIEVTGSPLEAPDLQAVLSQTKGNVASSYNYSLDRAQRGVLAAIGAIGATKATYDMCEGATAVTAIVSIAMSGGMLKSIVSVASSTIVGTVISYGIGLSLGFLIPVVAEVVFSNQATITKGIPAGEKTVTGTYLTNGMIGRTGNGLGLATADSARAFLKVDREVATLDADTDRHNRSPFDISSKNTFLGSIAYSFLPVIISTRQNTLKNISTVISHSFGGLLSQASATNSSENYLSTFNEECSNLKNINAVGTTTCAPITISDPSTLNIPSDDPTYNEVIERNLDENGQIKDNSEFAKYINYVAQRKSPFGYADANIASELEVIDTDGVVGAVASNAPILGDAIDLVNSLNNLSPEVKSWVYGDYAVMGSQNPRWNSEFRYFQLRMTDDRVCEQIGCESSENITSAYIERYEAEHPADNSPAGYLSQISGLRKQDAETVIAIAEYQNYLANYDQSQVITTADATHVATFEEGIKDAQNDKIHENHNFIETFIAILSDPTIYTDLRNRNYLS